MCGIFCVKSFKFDLHVALLFNKKWFALNKQSSHKLEKELRFSLLQKPKWVTSDSTQKSSTADFDRIEMLIF